MQVYRRYSDFEWLFNRISNEFPGVCIPTLPSKDFIFKYFYQSEEKSIERQKGLNDFLNRV